jgi:cytochrome c553
MLTMAAAAPAIDTTSPPPTGVTLCQGCHGANGEGMPAAGIPRIAGQSAEYLEKQLRDYASGIRENPIMSNWAKQLSDPQKTELAAYYASRTAPNVAHTGAPAAATPAATHLARGHQLAHQGDEAKRVQACNNCHGPDGIGVTHSAPYLAGQSAEYLTASLKSWKDGTRKNDAGKLMASVVSRLNDADIAAVAAYFASLGT